MDRFPNRFRTGLANRCRSRLRGPALAALFACAVAGVPAAAQAAASQGVAPQASTTRVAQPDGRFMIDATQTGLALLWASQRVLERSTDPQVRDYARRMLENQTRLNAQVSDLAQAKGVTVPTQPSTASQGRLRRLDAAHGRDFDRRYIDDFAIATHDIAVRQFRTEQEQGSDPQVKALAARLLPAFEQHLQQARQLQAQAEHRGTVLGNAAAPAAGR